MIGGVILSFVLKFLPEAVDLSFLSGIGFAAPNGTGVFEIPFLDRMGIVFVFCVIGMILISLISPKRVVAAGGPKGLEVDASMFRTSTAFTVIAILICGILIALYAAYW